MEINFRTKEESNAAQEKAFLALSGTERMLAFFALMEQMKSFPSSVKPEKKDNFLLDFTMRNE